MSKSASAFRTISEVADWLGVQTHVLRFWESKFPQVKPVKRAGGRRYYRPTDMLLLGGIKKLLHDDGLTIKGVQKMLREQGVPHISSFSQPIDPSDDVIEGTLVDQTSSSEDAPTDPPVTQSEHLSDETPPDQPRDQFALFDLDSAPAQENPNKPAKPAMRVVETAVVEESQPDLLSASDAAPASKASTPPGILTYAARLRDLSGPNQAEIAQLAQQLRSLLDDAQNAQAD